MKIKPKMMILLSGVVLLSILPLSAVMYFWARGTQIDNAYEFCRTLGKNISDLATEELLIDQTYDATSTAIHRLGESNIRGLVESYVINLDGRVVASLSPELANQTIDDSLQQEYLGLNELRLQEGFQSPRHEGRVLRFTYPISITTYQGEQLRVGTAVFDFDQRTVIDEPIAGIRNLIFWVSITLLVIALILGFLAAFFFSKPIQILSDGARRIGEGDLDHRIRVANKDELGDLATAFNRMTEQIQDFTQNLEQKVKDRTEELNRTLQEVQALKSQQDGDYFLTSLLMEPLQKNNNKTRFVRTEFRVQQKKHFQFKKWNSEIGGDLCITDTIPIGDREYTVFLNTDAMGKSIQGAGGALVLGAVFHSILVRSKIARYRAQFPENWLKDTFLDLQNIFVSFNGSMLMSMVLGLVDERGVIYFVNAEHPYVVLYRNGEASFLEENIMLRKVGVPGEEDRFAVQMFQLEPGDVILAGSDGRDDIMVQNEEGVEEMNEDETEFLRRVEDGEGNIASIMDAIERRGSLTDDLSLLRVSYQEFEKVPADQIALPQELKDTIVETKRFADSGQEEEAMRIVDDLLDDTKRYPELLKLAGNVYLKAQQYDRALECFLEYIDLEPADNEYLHVIVRTLFAMGDLDTAIDYGERLYLRDREDEENLLSLGAIYFQQSKFERAMKFISELMMKNPDNPEARSLYETLRDRLAPDVEERVDPYEIRKLLDSADDWYSRKKYYKAMDLYAQVVQLEDDAEWALFRLGNCAARLKKKDDAIRWYNRTLIINAENFHARNNLATLYFEKGEYDQAEEHLKKALEVQPDFEVARRNLESVQNCERRDGDDKKPEKSGEEEAA